MSFIATVILIISVIGAVRVPVGMLPLQVSFVYGALNFFGQTLAVPFAVASAALMILDIFGIGDAFWPALGALLMSLANIGIALRGGEVLLQSVGAGERFDEIKREALMTALNPFKRTKPGVEKIAGLAYGDAGFRNQLDLYRPETLPNEPMPILIHIHGGAWVIGQKDQQAQPLIQNMASKGWLVADINYRLGPKNRFPILIEDVLRAIHWVKTHAAEYGGDPNFVALTGGSAGGHLTALATLKHDHAPFKSGFEDADCSVQAAVPVYGKYDLLDTLPQLEGDGPGFTKFMEERALPLYEQDPDLWHNCSPLANARADAPPIMIIQGEHDILIPFREADAMAIAMKSVATNTVIHAHLPGAQHAYDVLNGPVTPFHVAAVETFLDDVRHGVSAAGPTG